MNGRAGASDPGDEARSPEKRQCLGGHNRLQNDALEKVPKKRKSCLSSGMRGNKSKSIHPDRYLALSFEVTVKV